MDPKTQLAVVGATGIVGRELLKALQDREHPAERVTVLASERSEGLELDYGEETLAVERATPDAFRGMRLVFLAVPGEAATPLAVEAQKAGAWVVDLSPAFRSAEVPLILPGINLESLDRPFKGRVVSCPSPIASAIAWLSRAIGEKPRVVEVTGTVLVSASSAGVMGVSELEQQTAALMSGRDPEVNRFPHRLSFNVVPQVGGTPHNGWFSEERSVAEQVARLLAPPPFVSLTAAWVPTFFGHFLSLCLAFDAPISPDALRDRLQGAPRLKVLDAPEERVYPMPQLVTDDAAIHVGRIRAVDATRVALVCALDNAGFGAAQVALDIGERLASRG